MSAPAANESMIASSRFGKVKRTPSTAPSSSALDATAPNSSAVPTGPVSGGTRSGDSA